ncbi:MAG: A24 family peptidase [Anaerolineae bacterium]|jgi:leader peptidase (prepilin peptidase)/N-methyltransferase|nr:A24 family peptidase [Anaerolineae bacterium]
MALLMLLVAVIGIFAGGVVNVLADDLPKRRNPRLPHYPDDTPRPLSAWLGLSAFVLGKRTSPNGVSLSWRYPLTELLTSGLMVLTVYVTYEKIDMSALQLGFWLLYMALLVLVTVIDVEHKLILFVVMIPFGVITLLDALLTGEQARPVLQDALIGGAAGFMVYFILYNGGFLFTYIMGKLRGREIREVAFGYGDVMLSTVSGLMLGWQGWIFATFITVFLGAFGALLYILSRQLLGKRYSAFTAIPYGPYIVIGTLIMLLFPNFAGTLSGLIF